MSVKVINFPKRGPLNGLGLILDSFTPVNQGTTGPYVAQLQRQLYAWGFTPGVIDGIYGPNTASAVRELQKVLRVPQTGNFDGTTVKFVSADVGQRASVLRSREEDNLTRPPPPVATTSTGVKTNTTSTAIQPANPSVVDPLMPPENTGLPGWVLPVGLGVGALVLFGLAMRGKKKLNSPVAGEDYFGNPETDDDIEMPDDLAKKFTPEYMKMLEREFAEKLADEVAERIVAQDRFGRRTEPAPGVEGLGSTTSAKQAMKEIKALGMKVKRVDGEFRIAPKGLSKAREEAVAYYTDDPYDAVQTAQRMAHEPSITTEFEKDSAMVKRHGSNAKYEEYESAFEQGDDEFESAFPKDEDDLNALNDNPKNRMQTCAAQWRSNDDKGGTSYREFMKSCMKR